MAVGSGPAAEMAQLEYFVGVWEGTGFFLPTPMFPGFTQPRIQIDAAYRHRGCVLEQRFTWAEQHQGEGEDAPRIDLVSCTRLWGFDAVDQRFVSEWFDDYGRRATMTSPGWEDDRLVTTGPVSVAGRTATARETFIRHGDDEWQHITESDFGQGWTKLDDQTLRRMTAF